jgi:hypothetical protein
MEEKEDDKRIISIYLNALAEAINFTKFPISAFIDIRPFLGEEDVDVELKEEEIEKEKVEPVITFNQLGEIYSLLVKEYCKLFLVGSQIEMILGGTPPFPPNDKGEYVTSDDKGGFKGGLPPDDKGGFKGGLPPYVRKKKIQSHILMMAAKSNQIPQSIYTDKATPTDKTFLRIIDEYPGISFLEFLEQVDSIAAKQFILFFLQNIPFEFSVSIAEQLEEECDISVEEFIALSGDFPLPF